MIITLDNIVNKRKEKEIKRARQANFTSYESKLRKS